MLSCFVGIVSLFRPALGLGTHLPLIISGQNDGILVLGHGVLGSRQEGVMERWLTCRVVEGTSEKLNFNLKKPTWLIGCCLSENSGGGRRGCSRGLDGGFIQRVM